MTTLKEFDQWEAEERTRAAAEVAARRSIPRPVRWLCRIGLHRPYPMRSGTVLGGFMTRYGCWCTKAYWLEDEHGRVRM